MAKLRVAITINYLAVGGSQSFALALAQGLSENGNEVFVYDFNLPFITRSLRDLNSPLLQSNSFSFFQFKTPCPYFLYNKLIRIRFLEIAITWLVNILRVRDFKKFVQQHKIDVVSSHLMAADTLSSFAIQKLKTVIHCATMHGSYEGYPKASAKKKREKVFSRINGIVYLTQKNIEFLKLLKHKNPNIIFQQIYNGYIPQIFSQTAASISRKELGIPEDSFVFIQVARGTQDKGWQETINAFLIALKKIKIKINLLLVGDGEFLSQLKTKYSIHPEIIFYGYSGNPIPLIELSDAGLLPTYYKGESLPNTIIEYLFSEKPVLATNIGEINNMLGIGTNTPAGYTFNLSEKGAVNETELSERMLEYITNKEAYQKLSANTKTQREKFRMKNCVNAYQHFFMGLLKKS